MTLMRELIAVLIRYSRTPKGNLCCIDCGKAVHKGERFSIVAVRHKKCEDVKLVGQTSFPAREDVPAEILIQGRGI